MTREPRAGLAAHAERCRLRLLQALQDGRRTQAEQLVSCLTPNALTAFGREHGLAQIANLDDYRRAVPLGDYSRFAPWIARVVEGEPHVLTREAPIRFWKTTGTTAQPKIIPLTPSASQRVMASFLALQGTQWHYYPELAARPDATLHLHLSPKPITERLGPQGLPYVTTTELPLDPRPDRRAFLPPWLPGLQELEPDDRLRLYYLLVSAAGHPIRAVLCLHPSRFQTVTATLAEEGPRLIREVREGTVLGRPVRPPDPQRAAALEAAQRQHGRLRPSDLWPDLQVLMSWSGSYLERYRPGMESEFGGGFLPMPSVSSEVFLTMTVDPDPISQPLNLLGGVFEFLPAESEPQPQAETLLPHQVEPGQTYEAVITTWGGLYRYATGDLFRVHGWVGTSPRLEFLGRRTVCDLTGEKLAEAQVAETVPLAFHDLGLAPRPFALWGQFQSDAQGRPGYLLLLEEPLSPSEAERLGPAVEQRLSRSNPRYQLKRGFGDLAPLRLALLAPRTFERLRGQRRAEGAPAGQLKETTLFGPETALLSRLEALGAPPCPI